MSQNTNLLSTKIHRIITYSHGKLFKMSIKHACPLRLIPPALTSTKPGLHRPQWNPKEYISPPTQSISWAMTLVPETTCLQVRNFSVLLTTHQRFPALISGQQIPALGLIPQPCSPRGHSKNKQREQVKAYKAEVEAFHKWTVCRRPEASLRCHWDQKKKCIIPFSPNPI